MTATNMCSNFVGKWQSYAAKNCSVNAVINLGWKEVWSDICDFFQVDHYIAFVSADHQIDVRPRHLCTTKKEVSFYVLLNVVS